MRPDGWERLGLATPPGFGRALAVGLGAGAGSSGGGAGVDFFAAGAGRLVPASDFLADSGDAPAFDAGAATGLGFSFALTSAVSKYSLILVLRMSSRAIEIGAHCSLADDLHQRTEDFSAA